jgi:hypothetical protein
MSKSYNRETSIDKVISLNFLLEIHFKHKVQDQIDSSSNCIIDVIINSILSMHELSFSHLRSTSLCDIKT